jgi:enamine deaminase RidA (YjgF/YER057c/UK114 family)
MGMQESTKDRQRVAGCSPYEGRIGFSRALRIGDEVFVSATAPLTANGTTACRGDAFGQAIRSLEIIESALAEAGAKPEDVVRVRMYISDRRHSEQVSAAFHEVYGHVRPAATMIICSLLEEDWLVEIEADARVGSG